MVPESLNIPGAGDPAAVIGHLVGRSPSVSVGELATALVPPRQFAAATFESYRPDPEYISQRGAIETLQNFARQWDVRPARWPRRTRPASAVPSGVYLDGGFGVGKTHLLSALWHAAPGPAYFGTFMEYTALVGLLGYEGTMTLLRGARLICIDEFELDDPGDTMLMTRILADLVGHGSRVAVTSNTPPNALGEGRFAAADFRREIQLLADLFLTVRIDGTDYRRRDSADHAVARSPEELEAVLISASEAGLAVTRDTLDDMHLELARVHPSKYSKLLSGVQLIGLTNVRPTANQTEALRFVAFVDRAYDAGIPIVATGAPLDTFFGGGMLSGGYGKKYLRAISRLVSLTARDPLSLRQPESSSDGAPPFEA